jgi:hypothetical protein
MCSLLDFYKPVHPNFLRLTIGKNASHVFNHKFYFRNNVAFIIKTLDIAEMLFVGKRIRMELGTWKDQH